MGQLTGGKTHNGLKTQTFDRCANGEEFVNFFVLKKGGREQVSVHAFSYNNNNNHQFQVFLQGLGNF